MKHACIFSFFSLKSCLEVISGWCKDGFPELMRLLPNPLIALPAVGSLLEHPLYCINPNVCHSGTGPESQKSMGNIEEGLLTEQNRFLSNPLRRDHTAISVTRKGLLGAVLLIFKVEQPKE